ncbi:MAG: response regulator transcription factor [Bryobacteraceae bacterium]|nr:response regulator transcription factor [Bryobacteraceae bacterium]
MIPRVLLVDDHPQVLANLSRLAGEVGEVVGAVQDGRAALAEARRLHPDVIVLDLTMPEVNGLEVARKLRQDMPESKVIICTVQTGPRVIEEAFQSGAMGFVQKQSAHGDLAAAICAVLAGDRFVSPALRYGKEESNAEDSPTDFHEGGER